MNDFVERFNSYRATNVQPSEQICVDESMSRWYGNGGDWINLGIPQYIAIDRKPENGGEIQDASCGQSGIMLRLKVVQRKIVRTMIVKKRLCMGQRYCMTWSLLGGIVTGSFVPTATLHLGLQLYFCGDTGYDLLG